MQHLRALNRRTSTTDPIRLDRVPIAGRPGTLSLTLCPGKKDAAWCRDLAIDLAALRAAGVHRIVYLLEDDELRLLGVPEYRRSVIGAGIVPHGLPIPDGGTLGPGGFDRMLDTVNLIRARLSLGEHVVVHCRGGLGRAGTVAACVLVSDGTDAADAITLVRSCRPGAIETRGQEAFVRGFAVWLDREGLRSL